MSKRKKFAAVLQACGVAAGVAAGWVRVGLWVGLAVACVGLIVFGVAVERDS